MNENDFEPVMFGEYEFTYSDESLQYFPVQVNFFLKFSLKSSLFLFNRFIEKKKLSFSIFNFTITCYYLLLC